VKFLQFLSEEVEALIDERLGQHSRVGFDQVIGEQVPSSYRVTLSYPAPIRR